MNNLIDQLSRTHRLPLDGYLQILTNATAADAARLAALARAETEKYYGTGVFVRGLIEISNYCKNDCYYCGIRRSNRSCTRYRLTPEQILECCDEGYGLGFRTFVMQGGEDGYFSDELLVPLLRAIKEKYPDCAITLSLGERSRESYQKLKQAGADRYLLRHETIDRHHYRTLHPENLSWQHRMDCLQALRDAGFQVGCGFMVGSPGQTVEMLARELQFVETFQPDMCGIGPFMPQHDTPFRDAPAGSAELTCLLLSCIRLIHPKILLPSTTALASLIPDGREKGILAGANVVMPNLSPSSQRKNYALYDNKLSDGAEAAQSLALLENKLAVIGRHIEYVRGDALQ